MNPAVESYVPSARVQAVLQSKSNKSSATATPFAVPKSKTVPSTPFAIVPSTANAAVTPMSLRPSEPAAVSKKDLTMSDRIRQLYPREKHPDPVALPAGPLPLKKKDARLGVEEAQLLPATTMESAPPQQPRARHVSARQEPARQDAPAVHDAPAPPAGGRYTVAQMREWEPAALQQVSQGPIVDAPPFLKLPAGFARLLSLPFALEYLDVDRASSLVQGRKYDSPLTHHNSARDPRKLYDYTCPECAQGGERPCEALASITRQVTRHALGSKLAAVLLQAPEVVSGLLQLALVFEAKQSSLRLRLLAEKHPRIPRLVGEYLFGEGYHLPLPPIVAHEDWQTLNSLLRFDYILKNKTRVKTDLSKHWRKRHNQFEQFVYFFGFREEAASEPTAVNMITRSVKPGMVAMLAGDVAAVLLLHNLNFFIPYDYYWSVFPYLDEALGTDSPTYCVVRHLGLHLSSKQRKDMYNPIINPFCAAR